MKAGYILRQTSQPRVVEEHESVYGFKNAKENLKLIKIDLQKFRKNENIV